MKYLIFFTILIFLFSGVVANLNDATALISEEIRFRQAILDSVYDIDENVASASLFLTESDIPNETALSLLEPLKKSHLAITFVALTSPEGAISQVSPGSYMPLVGTHIPHAIPDDGQKRPFISSNPEWSQTVPPGQDLVWPVRTSSGIEYIVIHLNAEKLCADAAENANISPEFFSAVLDHDGEVLWSSDYDELMSVPPEGVLTEFPTFRDVKDLMRYAWTGRTVHDVWNSNGIVRTGVWSSVQVYNQVWGVFVAE